MVLFGPLRQSLLIGLFFTVNEKYEPLAEAILYHLCRWLLLSSLSLTSRPLLGKSSVLSVSIVDSRQNVENAENTHLFGHFSPRSQSSFDIRWRNKVAQKYAQMAAFPNGG